MATVLGTGNTTPNKTRFLLSQNLDSRGKDQIHTHYIHTFTHTHIHTYYTHLHTNNDVSGKIQ